MRFSYAAFLLAFCLRVSAEVGLSGDFVRLRPTTVPVVCSDGDLRVDLNDTLTLKVCKSNVWTSVGGFTNPMTTDLLFDVSASIVNIQTVDAPGSQSKDVFVGSGLGNPSGNVFLASGDSTTQSGDVQIDTAPSLSAGGDSGNIAISTGQVGDGNVGALFITGGAANDAAGTPGSIIISPGDKPGPAYGKIYFQNAGEGTANTVWWQSATDGSGQWGPMVTPGNTASSVVMRNSTGSFTAGLIFANLSGTASVAASSGTASFATASTTASSSGTASFSFTSGTASFASSSGTASFATASTTASVSGTASFASSSGTASFATASTTASSSALADIAKVSTAFAATPTGCSASQFAHHIASSGNLTCAQVSFSDLSATASIAQGGTNNGTLAVTAGGMFFSDGSKFMNMGAGTSGQSIRSAGSGTPVWRAFYPTVQKYTSGAGTYTTATNALWIKVRMVGGGGGSGGVGTAATAGTGGTGGTTTFNSINANGGVGGSPNSGVTPGGGGAGGASGTGSATLRISGASGGVGGVVNAAYSFGVGGSGGSTPFGGGALPVNNAAGSPTANTGAGASGYTANSAVIAGSGGGGAGEYVELLINTPAATYNYTCGASGTAGAAGASGAAGNTGSAGFIIVEEYY